MSDNPPIALMLVPLPLLVAFIVGLLVGLLTGSWIVAAAAAVIAAAAVAAAAYLLADRIALRLLGARELASDGSTMLRNQLEEICARTGIAEPTLYTVGPGAPAIASVRRAMTGLIVTDGLTEDLTVVELEAAVAREIARAQSGSAIIDTLAVPFVTLPFGPFGNVARRALNWFRGGDHDARVDLDGIAITRYPPGMMAALSKMSPEAPTSSRAVAHLWATGSSGPAGAPGSFGLAERLEMLREL